MSVMPHIGNWNGHPQVEQELGQVGEPVKTRFANSLVQFRFLGRNRTMTEIRLAMLGFSRKPQKSW